MGLGLNSHSKAQVFTPYNIAQSMAEMVLTDYLKKQVDSKGWISVYDPACGAGVLLIAFANACITQKPNINYHTCVLFAAQDIDQLSACMCYIQLSLLSCPGYVVVNNSLTHPLTGESPLLPVAGPNIWFTPAFFLPVWQMRQTIEHFNAGHGR